MLKRRWQTAARRCVLPQFILLTLLFAIIYTQAPLYTSNQNLYFLPGLAKAGYGGLSDDWLANSPDPTPLFSLLVTWTYRLTHLEALFYVYYALLMGVYLFSALGIVKHISTFQPGMPAAWAKWLYLALFLLLHSAAWRFLLGQTLGANWIYLLEDGVADQRLLGSVFQPSAFGVLLVLSIYLFLKQHPYWAVICAALAASFHPTYLLSAAALTCTYVLLRLAALRQVGCKVRCTSPWRFFTLRQVIEACLPGFIALLAVLPILIYTTLNFTRSPAEIAAQARDILVNYRIPHHALVSWWFDATAVIKISLVVFALFIVRKTRLFWIMGIPFIVTVLLTILQVLSSSTSLALLFPWRISIVLVPLSTAIILAAGVQLAANRLNPLISTRLQTWGKLASLSLILVLTFIGALRLVLDFQRQVQSDDRPLFAYVAAHHLPGQLYLIPIKLQDFRLSSGAPVYVDFKNHPYQDTDVLEWYRRIQLATRFYKQGKCEQLPDWIRKESITHVVFPAEQQACPGLEIVYQDAAYRLYLIP